MTSTERLDPPLAVDEATTLRAFLDYHRDTFRLKTAGLDADQLATTLAPSTMTLGGMTKHLALVEDNWLSVVLLGEQDAEPWRGVDWKADPDWEWHTAAQDSPEELRRLLDDAVAASDRILDEVLAQPSTGGGLDRLSAREDRHAKQPFSLRWILVHLIEEYARHNGHADLIRESIDGSTGE